MSQLIFLNPVLKHNIWGGTRLREEFGYQVEGDDVGECWGIAAHPNGDCTVKGGSFDGEKLSALWKEQPELFGGKTGDTFPMQKETRTALWERRNAGISWTARRMPLWLSDTMPAPERN